MEIEEGGTEVGIKSEWERNDLEGELKVVFTTDKEPKIELEYATEFNAAENDLEF